MMLPININYLRSLLPGKAFFYHLDKQGDIKPLPIDQTYITPSRSGYKEMYTGNNLDVSDRDKHSLSSATIHHIEECYVPYEVDEIYCRFSLKIQPNSLEPNVCFIEKNNQGKAKNNDNVREILKELASSYAELGGYREIAERISKNILMGTWLWRSRDCRHLEISIQLSNSNDPIIIKNAQKLKWYSSWDDESILKLNALTAYIHHALINDDDCHYMDITAKMAVGWGDEIFPSQEFIDKKQDGFPSRQFARLMNSDGNYTPAFHAQKIGAALQMIDDWYETKPLYPLRTNEYGVDRDNGIARRHPSSKKDFYRLISDAKDWIEKMKRTKQIPDDIHFIIAVLIKGGVFNRSKD